MSSSADRHAEYHLLYGLMNTPVRPYPFAHLYMDEVFPADFYEALIRGFPSPAQMKPLAVERGSQVDDYPERFVLSLSDRNVSQLDPIWARIWAFVGSEGFRDTLLWKFQPIVAARIGTRALRTEALLVDDRQNYSIGPHTDNPSKILTALFYLPAGYEHPEIGTSIYLPNDPSFTCPAGLHHDFAGFQRVKTMPYQPNSMFAFAKQDNSFHAVERVPELKARRQLMIYDIYQV